MTDTSRQAWVDAVAAGETSDSFVDWWAARERESESYEPEMPEMIDFKLRIGVTTRAFYEIEFEEASIDAAIERARSIKASTYASEFENGIDGDEIGYLSQADDRDGDETEIDMRTEGEPYSWIACEIVKSLAKVFGVPQSDDSVNNEINRLISEAQRACATEPTGGEEG
ncbi:hypothetical protein [Mesorhizobium sp. M0058]|uniref:hypothetical protein n=1 Tax=Mesorhizobium sp. M0058 TaxID=2956865 RepID=UPI003336FBE8